MTSKDDFVALLYIERKIAISETGFYGSSVEAGGGGVCAMRYKEKYGEEGEHRSSNNAMLHGATILKAGFWVKFDNVLQKSDFCKLHACFVRVHGADLF